MRVSVPPPPPPDGGFTIIPIIIVDMMKCVAAVMATVEPIPVRNLCLVRTANAATAIVAAEETTDLETFLARMETS
jgi:hypothetical protein